MILKNVCSDLDTEFRVLNWLRFWMYRSGQSVGLSRWKTSVQNSQQLLFPLRIFSWRLELVTFHLSLSVLPPCGIGTLKQHSWGKYRKKNTQRFTIDSEVCCCIGALHSCSINMWLNTYFVFLRLNSYAEWPTSLHNYIVELNNTKSVKLQLWCFK